MKRETGDLLMDLVITAMAVAAFYLESTPLAVMAASFVISDAIRSRHEGAAS